jgi:hypothetical protein
MLAAVAALSFSSPFSFIPKLRIAVFLIVGVLRRVSRPLLFDSVASIGLLRLVRAIVNLVSILLSPTCKCTITGVAICRRFTTLGESSDANRA